jgi:hypothetical protein
LLSTIVELLAQFNNSRMAKIICIALEYTVGLKTVAMFGSFGLGAI